MSDDNDSKQSLPDNAPPSKGQPSLPKDEEIGDEGVVQVDAGDDSFLADRPTARPATQNPAAPAAPGSNGS